MNNVSFKANLVVNKNLYKNMPQGTPEKYTDELVSGYKKFLDHRVIRHVTDGDTIEISRKPYKQGFALNMKFISPSLEEPLELGIHTNKNIPMVTPSQLIYWTKRFIIEREHITQKSFFEKEIDMFKRALIAHYEKEKQ